MSDSFLSSIGVRTADAIMLNAHQANEIVKPMPLSPAAPNRPMRHIVTFKCKDFTPEKLRILDQALSELPTKIAELGDFAHGPDMGLREHNADYAITADFANEAAFRAFQSHPAYVNVVNNVIKPLLVPGEPIGRVQFKIGHGTRSRQTLMRADPPLFDVRFGKSSREAPPSPSSVVAAIVEY